METLLAIVSGAIFAASIFLILRKNLIRVTIGIVLITNTTNQTIFTVDRLTSANPPFIKEGTNTAAPVIANSLLQPLDRKSTRLNSSHISISYADFFLKNKKI